MHCFSDFICKESQEIILPSNKTMASFTLIETSSSKYGEGKDARPIYIAALNAFTAAVPKKTLEHTKMLQAAAVTQLPPSWDIRSQGTTNPLNGGKGIRPLVLNQGKCGSCWAHATN